MIPYEIICYSLIWLPTGDEMTETVRPAVQERSASTDRSRWIALVVLCAGMLMIILDQTIVNVALPSIQSDLGFSQSSLAWVVNAYLIAFGGLLLLAGRLGDLVGRRRIFMIGLTLFTVTARLPLAHRVSGQSDPGPHGRGHVRHVLPGGPVPAEGAWLQRRRGRPGVPAGRAGHRDAVAGPVGSPHHALRRQGDAAPRPGAHR